MANLNLTAGNNISLEQDGTNLIINSEGGGTASSDIIVIGDEEDITENTKIWIDTGEVQNLGSEVVDSLEGNETNKAPSVNAINEALGNIKYVGTTETGSGYSFSFTDENAIKKCYLIIATKGSTDGTFAGMWFIRTGGTSTATICQTNPEYETTLSSTINGNTITCTFSRQANYCKVTIYQLFEW